MMKRLAPHVSSVKVSPALAIHAVAAVKRSRHVLAEEDDDEHRPSPPKRGAATLQRTADKPLQRTADKPLQRTAAKPLKRTAAKPLKRAFAAMPSCMLPPPPDVVDNRFIASLKTFQDGEVAGKALIAEQHARARAGRMPGVTDLSVSTMTMHISLRLASGGTSCIGTHMMKEHLALERVREYSERTIGCVPTLSQKLFNGNPILQIENPKDSGYNNLAIQVSETLSIHLVGAKTLDQFLGLAEYCRGLIQAIKGEKVMLVDFKCGMINSNFMNGNVPVDRKKLMGRLRSPALQVLMDTDVHAAVRYKLYVDSVASTEYPLVFVFANGKVTIQAKNFDMLAAAHEHVLGHISAMMGLTG